jgi:hypothetical protein
VTRAGPIVFLPLLQDFVLAKGAAMGFIKHRLMLPLVTRDYVAVRH